MVRARLIKKVYIVLQRDGEVSLINKPSARVYIWYMKEKSFALLCSCSHSRQYTLFICILNIDIYIYIYL